MPDYRNTKIRIKSPEHSEYVQRILFENGFKWADGNQVLQHLDRKQLFIWPDMEITRGCYSDKRFDDDEFKEIFIEMEEEMIKIRPDVNKEYDLKNGYTAKIQFGDDSNKHENYSVLYMSRVDMDNNLIKIKIYHKSDFDIINKAIACFGIEIAEDENADKITELEKAIQEEKDRHAEIMKKLQQQIDELKKIIN